MAEQLEHFDVAGLDVSFGSHRLATTRDINPQLAEFLSELIAVARKEWGDDVWRWFDDHREDRILRVKKWFLSFTFRVKHCEALVRILAGPRPEGG